MTNASPRRIGAADSKTRARLVDAAEQLMAEEGYAAVTSRRVGAKAGLKPQLVHYYFRTMDDLFLEVFRRRAEVGLAHVEHALAADPSLRTLWELTLHTIRQAVKDARELDHSLVVAVNISPRNRAASHFVRGSLLRSNTVPTVTVNCSRHSVSLHW